MPLRVPPVYFSLSSKISINESLHYNVSRRGTFTVGGYRWAILYYPCQLFLANSDGYISLHDLHLKLLREAPADIKVLLCFSLVYRSGMVPAIEIMHETFTYYDKGNVYGFRNFTGKKRSG